MTSAHAFDREEVMAYLDGELTASREGAVRAHLDGCAQCRALVDELRHVSTALGAWQVEAAPAGLRADLARASTIPSSASVEARSAWPVAARRKLFGLPRWTLVAAPAGVLLLAAVLGSQMTWERTAPDVVAGPTTREAEVAQREAHAYGQSRGQAAPIEVPGRGGQSAEITGPMIVRTATLKSGTDRFDEIRASLEKIVAMHQGRIGSLRVTGEPPARRSLQATLRIPSPGLDAALGALRALGSVRDESIASEEITDTYRDLRVRITNSRREEQRLVELLAKRTGDLADVLAVEQALARVRGEVEQMEAQERAMKGRVDFATVTIQIDENYRAEMTIGSQSIGGRLRNAFVDGVRDAASGVVDVALGLLSVLPSLAIWVLMLFWPARLLWRRVRRPAHSA